MMRTGVLSDISDASMCVAHESVPFVVEFFWYFLGTILLEKVVNFLISLTGVMRRLVIGNIVWHKCIWTSDTDKALFLLFNSSCPSGHIEILFRLPINWHRIRIVTDSTRSRMISIKSSHITDKSVYIFVKQAIPLTGIRIAEINNMEVLKTISTKNDVLSFYLV